MKVLQVITGFQLGGAEDLAIDLSVALTRRGHDCRLVAVRPCSDDIGRAQKRRLREAGVVFYEYCWSGRVRIATFVPFKLAKLFREWRPDIVHSYTDIPDLVVGLASRLVRVKLARSIHNTVLWPTRWILGGITEMACRDDLVFACSEGAKTAYKALRNRYRLWAACPRLVYNGVEIPDGIDGDAADLEKTFRLSRAKIRLLFAGRFVPQKGFDVLLDALAMMPPSRRDKIELHAIGSGPQEAGFRSRVASTGLPVIFHEPIERIARIYPLFDALIMPSRFDGLSLVGAGALAAGVPILTTTAAGSIETVPPGWPLVCQAGDPDSLAEMLGRIIDGNIELKALGAEGAAWARDRFSLDAMIDAYERGYVETCAMRHGPRSAGVG